jgi:hypothetical protein
MSKPAVRPGAAYKKINVTKLNYRDEYKTGFGNTERLYAGGNLLVKLAQGKNDSWVGTFSKLAPFAKPKKYAEIGQQQYSSLPTIEAVRETAETFLEVV